jgi:glycosyltransferase involved in cell wall biosynthesis
MREPDGRIRQKVSVVIPTFNSARTIGDCLRSVRAQGYRSVEIMVVDSCSSDDTPNVAQSFGARIIQEKCNAAAARNTGVTNSTGEYVLFLDSDQMLSCGVIKECVEKCRDEGAEMIVIPEIFVGRGYWSTCSAVWKNNYSLEEEPSKNALLGSYEKPRFFVKKRLVQEHLLDHELVWGEDLDLHERLKRAKAREATCHSKIYHFEVTSLHDITMRSLHYGKSMPTFTRQTRRQVFPSILGGSFLTLRNVLRHVYSPAISIGCVMLLSLRALSLMVSLPVGFLVRGSEIRRNIA